METNVSDLKAYLSEYLPRAALGEQALVTLRGKPLARLVPEFFGCHTGNLG